MKTPQEVAQTVNPNRYNAKTSPGKAQQIILDALGIQAQSFGHANGIFNALGIAVTPKRVGRRSVPEVTVVTEGGWQRNIYGDYDGATWSNADEVDLSAIKEWVVDND